MRAGGCGAARGPGGASATTRPTTRICSLPCSTCSAAFSRRSGGGGPDLDGRARDLAEKAGGFYDDLVRRFPDPPLGLVVSLYPRLVEAEYGRSASGAGPGNGAAAGPRSPEVRLSVGRAWGTGRALRARHRGND